DLHVAVRTHGGIEADFLESVLDAALLVLHDNGAVLDRDMADARQCIGRRCLAGSAARALPAPQPFPMPRRRPYGPGPTPFVDMKSAAQQTRERNLSFRAGDRQFDAVLAVAYVGQRDAA